MRLERNITELARPYFVPFSIQIDTAIYEP